MRLSWFSIIWFAFAGLCLVFAPVLPLLLYAGLGLDALLAILLATDAMILRQADRLRAIRKHEEILSLGAENLVTITVENSTHFAFNISVRDLLPEQCELASFMDKGALPPYSSFSTSYHLTPRKRGEFPFGPLTARIKSRLGLWILQRAMITDDAVKVYPNIMQTRQQHLLSRRMRANQMGLRSMRLRGQGAEFESLRDYLPDDELRKVDWNASARRGNMVTKLFDIERSQQIMIVLDLGRTMATHLEHMTKLDHAINASVLLTYVSAQSQDRVGVMAFADEVIKYMPPGKGAGQMPLVLEQLYPLQAKQLESDYRGAFTFLARRLRKRSLIIIFTDLIDPDSSKRLMDNLALLHPQHLVLCVALSDYELREMMSGAPTSHTAMYQQAVASTVLEDRQLALATLHQRGILTVDAAPSDLSVAVVNRYLAIKREGRV